VSKARRLGCHSTLSLRVIKKKKKKSDTELGVLHAFTGFALAPPPGKVASRLFHRGVGSAWSAPSTPRACKENGSKPK